MRARAFLQDCKIELIVFMMGTSETPLTLGSPHFRTVKTLGSFSMRSDDNLLWKHPAGPFTAPGMKGILRLGEM